MRRLKCFGLLLALPIMLGLSLNVCLDTNAYKYEVTSIPIGSPAVSTSSNTGSVALLDFLTLVPASSYTQSYNVRSPHVFRSALRSSDNRCYFVTGFNAYDSDSYRIGFNYSLDGVTQAGLSSWSPICNTNKPFGPDNIPPFDAGSFPPYIFGNPNYNSMLPYSFDYSAYTLGTKRVDDESGNTYSYQFNFSDVYGVDPNRFRSLTIPLTWVDSSKIGTLSSGRPITIKGIFDFSGSGNYVNLSTDFVNHGHFRIHYIGVESSSLTTRQGYFDCSSVLNSLEFNSFLQLAYTCSFELPYNFDYLGFSLDLGVGVAGGDKFIWDTNASTSFYSSFIVTDYNEDPDPDRPTNISDEIVGGNLDESPSEFYLDSTIAASKEDWLGRLIGMFAFSESNNPVAAIGNMFHDNNTCITVPDLAEMLHSETQYFCPWFNSNIRSIVTPVLSFSALMLLFGFFVRWLGSSSGNLFEDTSHETLVPPRNSGTWGRRKK